MLMGVSIQKETKGFPSLLSTITILSRQVINVHINSPFTTEFQAAHLKLIKIHYIILQMAFPSSCQQAVVAPAAPQWAYGA